MITFALLVALLGAVNPDVTQANLQSTVCARGGWTRTVRPSRSESTRLKRQLLRDAHLPVSEAKHFQLDHRVPLEIGGAPRDPQNLWLQPLKGPAGAKAKDLWENEVHHALCSNLITLAQAQSLFLVEQAQ